MQLRYEKITENLYNVNDDSARGSKRLGQFAKTGNGWEFWLIAAGGRRKEDFEAIVEAFNKLESGELV